jgi:hypothetical protein
VDLVLGGTVFSCHILISCVRLKLPGEGAVKDVAVIIIIIIIIIIASIYSYSFQLCV